MNMTNMMNMTHLLTVMTLLPVVGALGALLAGRGTGQTAGQAAGQAAGQVAGQAARSVAAVTALLSLLLASWIWLGLNPHVGMSFVEHWQWVPGLGIDYHLGVDGLGALMLILSALVTLMAVVASRRVTGHAGLYFALMLLLEAGLIGTFTALNFFHWFLFWELSLIPAFFLIRLWGGSKRASAATQFFVYTMVGSVALLLAFLALFVATGSMEFDTLAQMASAGTLVPAITAHLGPVSLWLALGVLLGFAVKVPLMPFHTWLPATYAEAPTPVTMLLTGAMSKMGVYGLLRLALPIFGAQLAAIRTPLLVLAVLTVVAGAWAAVVQKDLKRIFAYSSVNHLGYCLMGLFAVALPVTGDAMSTTSRAAALEGVVLQMFNHGLTAAAIFWFLAMLEERSGGALGIDSFGGLRKVAPVFCGLMGVALFSSLGLPGLNGFVSEFLIFRGVFPLAWPAATVAVLGLLTTAAVILTVIQRVFTGPLAGRWAAPGAFADLSSSERIAVAPVLALMLLFGLVPQLILSVVNPMVMHWLAGWRF